MKRFHDLVCLGACSLLLLPALAGCKPLEPVGESAPSSDTSWGSELRAKDTETLPLGLSSRAREIERSVGIGR